MYLLKALGIILAALVTFGSVGYAAIKYSETGDFDRSIASIKTSFSGLFDESHVGNFESLPREQIMDSPVIPDSGDTAPVHAPEDPFFKRYVLMYDGIEIIGDETFQKDVVIVLEFAKKYSPADYQFIKENNKWINYRDKILTAAAGGDGFSWGIYFKDRIKNRRLVTLVEDAVHESGHNFADSDPRNNPNYNTEVFAESFARKAGSNLSYVNQTMIDEFIENFNFSQFRQ